MALPKIQQPLFEITVPSTKKKVKYRPFTVKEEKILLIAQESKDISQIILSIKQIIGNCIADIDVEKLAMFDMEYILLNLRARSVSDLIEFKIKDSETEEEIELAIDIDEIEIKEFDGHTKTLVLSDDITLGMKYPHIDQLSALSGEDVNVEQAKFDMMLGCIDTVVQGEEVYKLSDFTDEEVEEFVDSFNSEHIKKLKHFFETMPVMKFEKEYTRKDGTTRKFVAQGTETFFI